MNVYFRLGVLLCLLGLQFIALQAHASFFIKRGAGAVSHPSHPVRVVMHGAGAVSRMLPHSGGAEEKGDKAKSSLAVVAGIAGLLSIAFGVALSSMFMLIPAIVFGIVAIVLGATYKDTNRGLGYFGLALGVAAVVLSLGILVDTLLITTALF